MGKIVAIGGGEIGSRGHPVETTEIDKEIIRLSGKPKPRLLFIPTASSDSETYYDAVRDHFGGDLGCRTDVLYLLENEPSRNDIENKIFAADIVYVGGGNTLKMLIAWRKFGVDETLAKAYGRGIVLSGLSAGAICWFRYGSSDSRKFNNPEAGLIKLRGLDFIHTLCCPHYDAEADRRPHLRELMKKTSGVAIALDNCCAIEMVDDEYKIIASKSNACAYKVYYKRGEYREEIISQRKEFVPIERLVAR